MHRRGFFASIAAAFVAPAAVAALPRVAIQRSQQAAVMVDDRPVTVNVTVNGACDAKALAATVEQELVRALRIDRKLPKG